MRGGSELTIASLKFGAGARVKRMGLCPVNNWYSTTAIDKHRSRCQLRRPGLFRARVVERQGAPGNHRQLQSRAVRERVIKQFGDPEIEQMDATVIADQNVGRLQIAMNDQIAVRILHRIRHLQKHCSRSRTTPSSRCASQ